MDNELQNLVVGFDHTYNFSDDHRYWVRGEAATKRIIELLKGLTPAEMKEVEELWTATVNARLVKDDDTERMFGWNTMIVRRMK